MPIKIARTFMCCASAFFFFSSRRRHTRCSRDWSSDVCSSDLRFEKLANSFASCLLLPAECVLSAFAERLNERKISYADLVEIAREFDVSTEEIGRASCRERV